MKISDIIFKLALLLVIILHQAHLKDALRRRPISCLLYTSAKNNEKYIKRQLKEDKLQYQLIFREHEEQFYGQQATNLCSIRQYRCDVKHG